MATRPYLGIILIDYRGRIEPRGATTEPEYSHVELASHVNVDSEHSSTQAPILAREWLGKRRAVSGRGLFRLRDRMVQQLNLVSKTSEA
jgi:hypothetical protein